MAELLLLAGGMVLGTIVMAVLVMAVVTVARVRSNKREGVSDA